MARKSVRSLLLTALLATPLLSYATQYPLTVTDLDGRQVTLAKEPQRIILQDGRDIMTLALLDRDNPFKRLVAWNNLAKKQDVATADAENDVAAVGHDHDMGFSDKGNVDLESVIARQPDLMIAQLRARPALMESGVIDKLSALHVPVLFVDYEIAPAKDTAPSIDLLGKVLNREPGQSLYRLLSSAAAVDSPEDRDHHAEGQRLRGSAGRQQRRLLLYPRPQRLGRAGGGGRGEQYRFAAAAGRLRVRFAGENHQHEARRTDHDRLEARQQRCCPWVMRLSQRR